MPSIKNKNNPFYQEIVNSLIEKPKKWLITGAAGFIGSHLSEQLLKLNQKVIGIDNFITGNKENIEKVKNSLTKEQKDNFVFYPYDITNFKECLEACKEVDIILQNAAVGSVPLSIKDPLKSHHNNVSGFINILTAAKESGIKRIIFASSSSVYGSNEKLPKTEKEIGAPLSPYAATKLFNEIYANVFHMHYKLELIGLRYFNVFGPRQNPNGPYAAVIPKWINTFYKKEIPTIFGDGSTSRDFCFVSNVVQANILAAYCKNQNAFNNIFNIAVGEQTNLNQLFSLIKDFFVSKEYCKKEIKANFTDFRAGDIKHSLAEISKAQRMLGYNPLYSLKEGLQITLEKFWNDLNKK